MLLLGLRKTAIVSGVSMYPYLKNGDIIVFKSFKLKTTTLKVGDIIIFNHPLNDLLLIKRINSITNSGIEVIGDNKEFSKDSNFFGLIPKEKVIGIYSSKINYLLINKIKRLLTNKDSNTLMH